MEHSTITADISPGSRWSPEQRTAGGDAPEPVVHPPSAVPAPSGRNRFDSRVGGGPHLLRFRFDRNAGAAKRSERRVRLRAGHTLINSAAGSAFGWSMRAGRRAVRAVPHRWQVSWCHQPLPPPSST